MKVNFVSEFNAIMRYARNNGLSSRERLLWIGLFTVANDRAIYNEQTGEYDWPEGYISIPNGELTLQTTLNKRGIETVRESLKELGVIEYIPGARNTQVPRYKLNYLTVNVGYKSVPNDVPSIIPNDVPNGGIDETDFENAGCDFAPNIAPTEYPDRAPYTKYKGDSEKDKNNQDKSPTQSYPEREQVSHSSWTVADGQGGVIDLLSTITDLERNGHAPEHIHRAFGRARLFFADHPPGRGRRTHSMAARYLRGLLEELEAECEPDDDLPGADEDFREMNEEAIG